MAGGLLQARGRAAVVVFVLAAIAMAISWRMVFGASLTVTTLADVVDGNTSSIAALLSSPGADGAVSLREAVLAANAEAASGPHTITLPTGTLTLGPAGQLTVTAAVTITGAGATATTVSGGNASRIFNITGTGGVTLSALRLTSGTTSGAGGAVQNGGGALVLNDVVLDANGSDSVTDGGAISSAGSVTLSNVTATNNRAYNRGGVLYLTGGTLTVTGGSYSGNRSVNSNCGALSNAGSSGTSTIAGAVFNNNTAGGTGGAVCHLSTGTISVTASSFSSNTAFGNGGAVLVGSAASALFQNTSFSGNTSTSGDGGALRSAATQLALLDSTVSDNSAGGQGGAVLTAGSSASVTASTFSRNVAWGAGGALHNASGTLAVSGGRFDDNRSTSSTGGAVHHAGTLLAAANLVIANAGTSDNAGGGGGGIYVAGPAGDVSLTDVTMTGLRANDAGGALWLSTSGTLTVTRGSFSGNLARSNDGGAFYLAGTGARTIASATLRLNESGGAGGAVRKLGSGALAITDSTLLGNRASGVGGALSQGAGAATLSGSAVVDNASTSNNGGGVHYSVASGSLVVTNATFSDNAAESGEGGGLWIGGSSVTATITNTTLTLNSAWATGGGLRRNAGTVSLRNVLIAGNTSTTGSANCAGTLTNVANNLDSGTTCGFGTANASRSSTDPLLQPLADNGGPTPTHALGAGSPAIDAGTATGAPAADQRGAARVGAPDIGAFEAGGTAAMTLPQYLVGNGVPTAVLSPQAPSTAALGNPDPSRDGAAGLLLARGGSGAGETDPTRVQTWLAPAGTITLSGPLEFVVWSAVKNFDVAKGGALTAFLLDCNGAGASCTTVATSTLNQPAWSGGVAGFVEKKLAFGNVSYSVGAGRRLAVRLIVPAASADDLWLAYDTASYPSRLQAAPTYAISGTVFEDVNYGGGAGRSLAASGGAGVNGARVELYDAGGAFLNATTSSSGGGYAFAGLSAGTYHVRVASQTVLSTRSGTSAALRGVQSFRTTAPSGVAVAVIDQVGGTQPALADPGSAAAGTVLNPSTFAFSAGLSGTAHAVAAVTIGSGGVGGVDFGFHFGTVVNTNASGQGSLRQAIVNANTLGGDASLAQSGRTSGIEHIVFMIANGSAAPGLRSSQNLFSGGVASISPASALAVTTSMVIDAQTQPGWVDRPIVELRGTGAPGGSNGMDIGAGPVTLRGFVVNRWPSNGINVTGGSGHVLQGLWSGLDSTGTAAAANGSDGLSVTDAPNATIGGSLATQRNVLSGNSNNGLVLVLNSGGAVVRGNYVGTNVAGTSRVQNGSLGVYVRTNSSVTIGGAAAGEGNVISGNTWQNVIVDTGSAAATLMGNRVGPVASGTTTLPSGAPAIELRNANNIVGGSNAGEGNTIAAAAGGGVVITGSTATGNVVRGNAVTGTGSHGISITGSAGGNTVGGTGVGAGNTITGNSGAGISVTGGTGNALLGNSISGNGGLGIDLGNSGVTVNDAGDGDGGANNLQNFPVLGSISLSGASQVQLAGTLNSSANSYHRIEFFASAAADGSGYGEGQRYVGAVNVQTDGSGNASFSITLTGVAIGEVIAATATRSAVGYATFTDTSEFSAVVTVPRGITGAVFEDRDYGGGAGRSLAASGGSGVAGARVELYNASGQFVSTTTTASDGTYAFGGVVSGTYFVRVASQTVQSGRSGSTSALRGVMTFRTNATGGSPLAVVNQVGGTNPALADAASGSSGTVLNTSTFAFTAGLSGTAQAVAPVTVGSAGIEGIDFGFNFNTVVNTNDSGQGSLRQFVLNSNALGNAGLAIVGQSAGKDVSIFMIPSTTDPFGRPADPNFTGGRAVITLSTALPTITGADTSIDAGTQTTHVGDSNAGALGAGGSVGVDGLTLSQVARPEVEIRGSSSITYAITIAAANFTLRGVSLWGAGSSILLSSASGALIESNVIGTGALGFSDPGAGTRSAGYGIYSAGVSGTNGTVRNNLIGFHGLHGIWLQGNGGWTIENNEIRGNGRVDSGYDAIGLSGSSTTGATVRSNLVIDNLSPGLDVWSGSSGHTVINNSFVGNAVGSYEPYAVRSYGVVGAATTIEANIVTGSPTGIAVGQGGNSTGYRITRNAIWGNSGLGIDLANVASANDGSKSASQPNLGMDSPVISAASLTGTTLTVSGWVGSASGQSTFGGARVEIFVADGTATYASGRIYLGALTAAADGTFSGTITGVSSTTLGSNNLTATATDGANNTSEFGPSFALASRSISGTVFEDVNYGGGAGRNLAAASGGGGRPGARVELYAVSGTTATFSASTTTNSQGAYSFGSLNAGSYAVRVVGSTVSSSRSGYTSSLLPVLTFRTDASSGTVTEVANAVGGTNPAATAAGDGATGASFDTTTGVFTAGATGTAQAVTPVTLSTGALAGVDFGFNFDTVVNTNDSGAGSLRQAIVNANTLSGDASLAVAGRTAGIEHLVFMISNGSSAAGLRSTLNYFSGGAATVALSSALPPISGRLVVNAQTQPGWSATPVVLVDGNGATGNGIDVAAGGAGSQVSGLVLRHFTGHGINIASGASGVTITGNHIGRLTAAGTDAGVGERNTGSGIVILGTGTIIGGSSAAQRNVIAGNGGSGLSVGSSGTLIRGNYIGVDATGATALGNGNYGIDVGAYGPSANIGGTAAGEGNVISANNNAGVLFQVGSSGWIKGNRIGTNAAGTATLAGNGAAVHVWAAGVVVGGTEAGAGNVITGANTAGIKITGSAATGVQVSSNGIYGHSGLGIDLGDNGTSANDGAKTSGQPNLLMDAPVFASATLSGTTLTVNGYVGSAPMQPVFGSSRVEIFVADASGTGRTYLGFVTADANGAFTGTLTGVTLQQADSLTATATDASGNTSEFGAVYALSRNVGGVVYEDLNYGGGAGRDRSTALAAGGRRLAGATVELYSAAGSLLSSTTTAADGSYSFASVANSHYFVRVVTSTVRSSRTGNAVGQWPVQTWRHEASWKTPSVVTDEVGGARPDTADSAAAPTLSWTQCATESGGSSNPCSFSGTRLVRFGAGSTWTVRVATGGVTCSTAVFGDPAIGVAKTCQTLNTPLHSAAAASTVDGDATVDFGYHFTTVVNTNDSGPGSLRQAMLNANALGDDISLATAGRTAAREHVVFMIANGTTGSGGSLNLTGGLRSAYNFFTTSAGSYNAATITLASALPPVTSPLVIDAQTQLGWTLEPRLEINGNGLGVNGFQLSGGGSTVRGFVLNRFTNAANSANGLVMIDGAGGNTLQGNWFGVDVSGSTATTAQRVCQGLVVNTGTNQIGGSTASLRNVVSNTSCNGVLLWAGDGNVIEGNYIGTNAAGTAALGHGDRGILVLGSASNTRIGGAAAGQGNVVAGSANASSLMGAVELSGSGAGNVVQGNRIGLNAAGTAVLANASHGIYLANTGTGTVIGGTATGAGNVVAGSGGAGVWLGGAAATVQGNYIGTNAAGTAALANASGIVAASGSQQIGGGVAGAGNLVSGNTTQGILLQSTASGSVVTGNVIGLAAGGAVALPNGVGITVRCASACTIGSAAGGSAANTISGNTGHGVVVTAGTGNAILGNAIYGNGGLGIDLGNNGVTANDGAKTSGQPNLLMDAPVFTEARSRGNQLTVKGHVGSLAGQSLFGNVRVEIFESDNDPSGAGEGLRLLGVLTTGADGRFSGTVTMPVNRLKMTTRLTGTATDTSNNTSEFGQQFTGLVVDFVVNTIADDVDANVGDGDCLTAAGFCSLRAAIAELNAWASLPQKPTIAFELPGCSTQGAAACRIAVTTQLPTLSRSMDIDATTQPGWNSTSFAPLVVLNGSTAASTASGLVLGNGTHGVRGLVINGFGQNGVLASTGSGHVIAGNWIGLDATGTAALANGVTGSATGGVYIVSATGVTVGGSTAADRNVLSGNGGAGVWASGGSSTVAGNHIGTNAAGSAAVGNGRWGVQIEAGSHAMLRNVVSGNTGAFTGGIFLNGVGQVVQGNLIGLNSAGTGAIPNGDPTTSFSAGVDARGGSGHVIGGTGTGEANRIAFNTGAGVRVTAQAVRISGNSFEGNSGLAIDLNADGVSANDGVFNSSAPNRGIDQPVFTGVGIDTAGTSALVFGFVGTGSGNAVFAGTTIEIYKAAADPSGYGEGRVFLGTLTADADGRFTGTLTFAAGTLVVGDVVTATATDGSGNTSEFGPNWTATTMDALTPAGFNAFDTPTATGSTAGPLTTRVAGVAGTVDVVALAANGGGLHPGFTGTVQLTWIDARNDGGTVTGSCRSSWVDVAPAGSAVFSNARRVTVNVTPPNGGTRAMRLKMVHTSSATPPVVTTACSGDALAVIPATLSLAASDADAASAGTARALSNATASGGVVHRAGRPFTVRAEARDALGALMAAYDGTPTLATAGCVLPAGCTAGGLSAASVTASAGVWRHDAVSYAEVGAVSLQLTDDAYAAIDAADTPAAARRIQSAAVTVGRFVPDSLLLSVSTTGRFATANGACLAAGSGATFIGQGFGWTTAPRVTVTARNAAGATTAYWTGALMKLAAGSGLVPDLAASNAGSTTLSRSFGPLAVSDLGGGQARLDASSTDRFVLELPAGSTTPPLTPAWTWSLAVTDASEAAVAGNPTLSASTAQAPVPFDLGAVFHSARLVLAPAHGDARTGVRPLVHLQRWTDAGWVTMTEDRGCVTVQPQHLGIESPSGVFTTAGLCAAPVAGAVTTQGGRAWLSLPATPGGAPGRQVVRIAGPASTGSACASDRTPITLSPLDMPWLLGGTAGNGSAAVLTWGSPNRGTVLRREIW